MRVCWYCGQRFDGLLTSGKTAAHCDPCQQIPIVDGSTEGYKLSYTLAELQNRKWTEEEWQMLTDSSLGADLAEELINRMDSKCLANLIRTKCFEAFMEARQWL
jgi:hypothetical protein